MNNKLDELIDNLKQHEHYDKVSESLCKTIVGYLEEFKPSYDDLLLFVNSVKTYLDPETDEDERGDPNDLLKWANSITG